MSDNNKYCPMMFDNTMQMRPSHYQCLKNNCAWWDEKHECCVVIGWHKLWRDNK